MDTGELLTRGSIWLALGCYFAAAGVTLTKGRDGAVRWLWTVGCAAYLAHVVAAFHFFHDWSHAAAYAETARQTAELTRWNWGGGIYINHLFTLVWTADALWWWLKPDGYAKRPQWMEASIHSFFVFMIFNGAVVFGHGPVRWFGVAGLGVLGVVWWRGWHRNSSH
ncbi:MAG: hypothetical protein AB1705_02145 [Verrucomicrobiota bacterium]